MANIGEQLFAPESGWKRIDDTDESFSFFNFNFRNNQADYNRTSHITQRNGATVNFIFYGSRIRIIGGQGSIFTTATVTIDGNVYKTTNNMSFTDRYQIIIFEKTDLQKTIHSVSLITDSSGYFIFDCIDIDKNGKLLSQEEYIKMMSCYIKQNNKYYSFSEDNYDTTTKMYKEITLNDINNGLYPSSLTDLTTEVTIGEETFKPIDKFNNFQFVSKYNEPKTIIGRKSKTGISIASGDIYTKVASKINSFTLDNTTTNNSSIKMAISFDNGSTWKTYKDGSFTDLSINIAVKTYENMTTDEKTNWDNAKTIITTDGFTPDVLSTIDFNTIENLSTIRFAYVLYQDLITDDCKVNTLSWQFDAKGSFQKMKDSEITTSFSNGVINLIPNENQDMIITNYIY